MENKSIKSSQFLFQDKVCHLHPDELYQVAWSQFELQASHSCTDIDMVEFEASLMDESRECFLHAYGRAAASDISRQRQQLLHRDEVTAFVSRGFCSLFKVEFVVARDDAYEITDFVAFQHQGLEHLVNVLTQLVSDMLRPEVVLVHLVGD